MMEAAWLEPTMTAITRGVGSPLMVPACLLVVVALYAVVGTDAANFVISITTLCLLPILQHSQNRDGSAIQAKLDELIKATADARNELIGIDKQTEVEIERVRHDAC